MNPQKGNSKNIIVTAAFIVLIAVIIAVVIGKFTMKKRLANQIPSYTNTSITNSQPTNSPTTANTSNTQIDQDLQSAQSGLTKLNGDINNASQDINNTSQDNPQ